MTLFGQTLDELERLPVPRPRPTAKKSQGLCLDKGYDYPIKALIMHIDPANLSLLNDRLTQLRLRKEHIEREIADAKSAVQQVDERGLRKWATEQLTGLREVLDGRRDEKARKVIAAYVDRTW